MRRSVLLLVVSMMSWPGVAHADSGLDADLDAEIDAPLDTALDVSPDVSLDETEAAVDDAPDGVSDAASDVAEDGADATPDTEIADVGEDVPPSDTGTAADTEPADTGTADTGAPTEDATPDANADATKGASWIVLPSSWEARTQPITNDASGCAWGRASSPAAPLALVTLLGLFWRRRRN